MLLCQSIRAQQTLLEFNLSVQTERIVRLRKMEEEISYSTVIFKNNGFAEREKAEFSTIYAEVKHKEAAATAQTDGEAAGRSLFHVSWSCLGILCVLLVTSISVIIYIGVTMNKQETKFKAEIQRLKTERNEFENRTLKLSRDVEDLNRTLNTERSFFESETRELTRVMDSLNQTLEAIMKFNTFPVNEFCPEKKCQPCQTGWIQFQEKCYLFYDKPAPWKTWKQSRSYCQAKASDLVIINNLEEQVFVSEGIKYYHDEHHGFWLGLHESEDKVWQWVDGQNVTLGYWMTIGASGPCGLIIPGRNVTANWDPAKCDFLNKFICETEPLIRLNG